MRTPETKKEYKARLVQEAKDQQQRHPVHVFCERCGTRMEGYDFHCEENSAGTQVFVSYGCPHRRWFDGFVPGGHTVHVGYVYHQGRMQPEAPFPYYFNP